MSNAHDDDFLDPDGGEPEDEFDPFEPDSYDDYLDAGNSEPQRDGEFAEARMRMIQCTDFFLNMEGETRFYTLLSAIKQVWMKMDAHGHQPLPNSPDQAATGALSLFWGEFLVNCLLVNCVLRGEAAPIPLDYPGMDRGEPPPGGLDRSRWVSSPAARQKIQGLKANLSMDLVDWLEPEVPLRPEQDPSVPDPSKLGVGFLAQAMAVPARQEGAYEKLIEAAESVCVGFVEGSWEELTDDSMRSRISYLLQRLRMIGSTVVDRVEKLRGRNRLVTKVEKALMEIAVTAEEVVMREPAEIRVVISDLDQDAWSRLPEIRIPPLLTNDEEAVEVVYVMKKSERPKDS